VVVALVGGGQAARDGLMREGDRVIAVNGAGVHDGAGLKRLIPKEGPFELTVERMQPELTRQIEAVGITLSAPLRLLKVPVRRGRDGLGVEVRRSLVHAVSAAAADDGLVRPGDVVVAVDGRLVGPQGRLGAVVEPGRAAYAFTLLRRVANEASTAADGPHTRCVAAAAPVAAASLPLEVPVGRVPVGRGPPPAGDMPRLPRPLHSEDEAESRGSGGGGDDASAPLPHAGASASMSVAAASVVTDDATYDPCTGVWSDLVLASAAAEPAAAATTTYDVASGVWCDLPEPLRPLSGPAEVERGGESRRSGGAATELQSLRVMLKQAKGTSDGALLERLRVAKHECGRVHLVV